MSTKINLSDIVVLKQIYLEENFKIVIYDPKNQLNLDTDHSFFYYENKLENSQEEELPILMVLLSPLKVLPKIDAIFDFSNTIKFDGVQRLSYINNPDKTIRWIYPSDLKHPDFLNLYNANSIKARVYKTTIKNAYKIGLKQKFASGKMTFFANKKTRLLKDVRLSDFAIFTGTVGENRKAIATICEDGVCKEFAKIAISKTARNLIFNESQQLEYLSQFSFEKLYIPKSNLNKDCLLVENVMPANNIMENNSFSQLHLEALFNLYAIDVTAKPIVQLQFFHDIKANIAKVARIEVKNELNKTDCTALAESLSTLLSTCDEDTMIPNATAHGDFTPWNMYITQDTLHLFDWELSKKEMPLLLDGFHFIFQNHILINRSSYNEIKENVKLFETSVMELSQQYQIDFNLHFRLYLIYNISYYLPLYMQQENLHPQVFWLLDIWKEAVKQTIRTQLVAQSQGAFIGN